MSAAEGLSRGFQKGFFPLQISRMFGDFRALVVLAFCLLLVLASFEELRGVERLNFPFQHPWD